MELFFRQYGEGKPVIILHGLFGMSDNWATFSKKLAAHKFSVYTPNLRNHGNSPHSDIFNYEALSNDLHEFILKHRIIDPIIIGHSLGGRVAMNFTRRFQGIAYKVIVIDMGMRNYTMHNDDILETMLNSDITSKQTRFEIEELLAEKIKIPKVLQLLMKNIQRDHAGIFTWKLDLIALKMNFHEIFKPFEPDPVSDTPILFIAAENSDYVSETDLPYINQVFPKAEILSIPGSSHWIHADKPEALLEIISNYIGT